MSHFLRVKTEIREREHLVQALRDLHHRFQVSPNLANDVLVRGYRGNQERAEVVVDTGTQYDIGLQRRADSYEIVADWWGVEQGQVKQAQFIQQLNRQYAYNVIRDQVREQGLVVEEERRLENGEIIITLSERG